MSENPVKVRCICVDTLTKIQEISYMTDQKMITQAKWKDYAQEVYAFIDELQNLGFEIILVLGPPGTGKSTGLKTLAPKTCIWYNADKKNPVWKGGKDVFGTKINPKPNYHVVPKTYGEILNHVKSAMKAGAFEERRFAFLTGHLETYKMGDETHVRMKTLGSLLNKMQVEANMETVLYSKVERDSGETEYLFETRNNGFNTCRSPEGAFEDKIPNDYQMIIDKLLEY